MDSPTTSKPIDLGTVEELHGCPFCGEQPDIGPAVPSKDGDAWTFIRCFNEHCSAEAQVVNYADATHRAEAIAAWNTRTPSDMAVRAEWQDIATAPRDGSYVLGFGPHDTRGTYMDVVHVFRGRWTITWMDGYGEPTHWQLLPAAPASEKIS